MAEPYWYPERTDDAWLARIREDYPERSDWDDESLREYFADGQKYATTWDHIGDAYNDYEPLADAFLNLKSEHATLMEAAEGARVLLARLSSDGLSSFGRAMARDGAMVATAAAIRSLDAALSGAGREG